MSVSLPDQKVYFFGTCLIDLFYPNAGVSAIQLLQREGIEVLFPQQQTCCGQPAWNSGYRDEARAVALRQRECFSQDLPIIVPSGSCAGMLKHHYPELFAGTAEELRAGQFAGRVWELTEYLVDRLQLELRDLGEPVDVVVHTSCSARREMQVAEKIETLLAGLEHVTVYEQAYKAECCGFGGTFAVKQPEISAAMVADKTTAIRETGVAVFVTQDCGCLMNIAGAFDYQKQQNGLPAPTGVHVSEFLWERTNGS